MKMTRGEKIQALVLALLAVVLLVTVVILAVSRKRCREEAAILEQQLERAIEINQEAEEMNQMVEELGSVLDRWRALGTE